MFVSLKFNQDDKDSEGNAFSALYVRFEDGKEVKHYTQDDYPRIIGLHNEVEIWDNELPEFKKMQLPSSYIQPYVSFLEDRMQVWTTFMPSSMSDKPDLEIPYLNVAGNWHKTEIKNYGIN